MFCVKCGITIDSTSSFCRKCGTKKAVNDEITKPRNSKSYNSLFIVGIGFFLGFLTIFLVISAISGGGNNTEYVYIEPPEQYYDEPYYHDDYYYYDEPYYHDDYYYYP